MDYVPISEKKKVVDSAQLKEGESPQRSEMGVKKKKTISASLQSSRPPQHSLMLSKCRWPPGVRQRAAGAELGGPERDPAGAAGSRHI